MAALSEAARAMIDGKSFATVATVEPDGSPQLSVVWVTRVGDDVVFSTLVGRRKHQNLVRDNLVTLLVMPPDNPYAYVEIRGAATMDTEGGDALIEALSQKYTGRSFGNDKPGDVRVVVKVQARKVVEHG